MILAVPEGTPPIYYNNINLFIGIVSIVIFFVIAAILFVKKKDEVETARRIKIGYGLFAIFYALCRVFFIIAVWFPDEPWNPNSYDFFVVIGYLFASVGLTSLIFVLEKYLITKTKRVFSVIGIVVSVLLAITIVGQLLQLQVPVPLIVDGEPLNLLGQQTALYISVVASPLLIAVIAILYMYLAAKSTADLRKKAVLILVAIALIGIASIFDSETVVVSMPGLLGGNLILLDLFYSIPPAMMIAGILLFLKNTY